MDRKAFAVHHAAKANVAAKVLHFLVLRKDAVVVKVAVAIPKEQI